MKPLGGGGPTFHAKRRSGAFLDTLTKSLGGGGENPLSHRVRSMLALQLRILGLRQKRLAFFGEPNSIEPTRMGMFSVFCDQP